ncbi:hypothetical protein EUGRSUZ_L00467 [Eucalyptus grandis]|uniref:Uncharacterized protein n=1 Tax=Eucalyptus grandis TaxID=71139 RepID=A0A058ZW92_EUCGR|nr:hypothetical protein EUGRSUZ_L00467 [Eucalyptus grandis]
MRWQDPDQVLGAEVQHRDSLVSTTACDTIPLAEVARIIPRAQNLVGISYLGLKFQQSQPISLVPSSFY